MGAAMDIERSNAVTAALLGLLPAGLLAALVGVLVLLAARGLRRDR